MANKDIRIAAMNADIKLYQIAAVLGMRENHFSRLLRYELPPEKKQELLSIIEQLAAARG